MDQGSGGSARNIALLTEGNVGKNSHRVTEGSYGIDRLSVSFPARFAARDGWTTQTRKATGRGDQVSSSVQLECEGSAVFVGVQEVAGEVWGKVEGNPARMVDPDGFSLAPIDSIPTLARHMWDVATEMVAPSCTLPEARLKRLDVARDFLDVGNPSLYVRSLVGVRRPYAKRAYVFSNPSKGNAETLGVGSGSGMARLYDQHQAYGEKGAPEGSMRWELEARDRWLSKVDLERVGDWNAEAVADITAERWTWSGCGLEVAAVDAVIEKVRRAGLSEAKQQRLLGRLLLQAQGFPVGGDRKTAAEYDRLIRDLGVVLPATETASTFVGRLDWASGTEVLRAA